MQSFASRAGRRPLAVTIAVIAALGACGKEPSAPRLPLPRGLTPDATVGAVYTVTNTNDAGSGSLRWALGFTTGGEIIRFDPALAGQTITVDSTLRIGAPVTIEGPADRGITISAGGKAIVFRTATADTVRVRNLSITGGTSLNGEAGGITGSSVLVVDNSAIYGNRSFGFAALHAQTLVLTNSTVSGNTSTSTAGYPAVTGRTKTLLVNSTIAHNTSGAVGVSENVVFWNSILANNTGANCTSMVGSIARAGLNVSDDGTCGGPTEMFIADPILGELADNGGPSRTHALLPTSPAINAGTSCSVPVDQRYVPRDAFCDIGAFEFTDFTAVTITIDPNATIDLATGSAMITGTVRCSRAEDGLGLFVQVNQTQKVGKTQTVVRGSGGTGVDCATTARPWSVAAAPWGSAFQTGTASVSAHTNDVPVWVTPAHVDRSVKLIRSRR